MFTLGHGSLTLAELLRVLEVNQVDVLADVRSDPYSRRMPHFTRGPLARAVTRTGSVYLHLGGLGGRPPPGPWWLPGGAIDYPAVARAPFFTAAMDRLVDVGNRATTCVLCAEEDPRRCHRLLLVGRELSARGVPVHHLRHDGRVETQGELERSILARARPRRQLRLI